jgi:hypothetical protein
MSFEKRAAFVELARGDMYKHMFYAARNGSTAGSATEGNKKGDITDKTIMCRYDRFVDILSGLPADAARRALEDPSRKISYRDELWNTHKGTGTRPRSNAPTHARTPKGGMHGRGSKKAHACFAVTAAGSPVFYQRVGCMHAAAHAHAPLCSLLSRSRLLRCCAVADLGWWMM